MPHHNHLRAASPPAGQLQRMHRRHRQPTPKGLHRRQGTLGDGEDNEELLPTATRPTPSLRPGREGGSPADLLSSLFSEGQAAVTSILGAPQDEASPFGSLTRCSQGCFDGFFPSDCRDDNCVCRSPNELQQVSACIAAECRGTDQRGFLATVGEQCGSAQSLSLALAAVPSTATTSSLSLTSSSTTPSSSSSTTNASSTSDTTASRTSPSSITSRSSSASPSIASRTDPTSDSPSTVIATVMPSTTLDVDNALSNNASNASNAAGSADKGGISTGQAVGIAFGLILGLLALGLCAWQTRRQLAGRTQRAREFYRTSKPGEWIPDEGKGADGTREKRELPNHSVPRGQRLSQKIPLDGQFWAGVKQATGDSREAAPSPLPENPFGVRMQSGQMDGGSYAGIGRRSLVPHTLRASTLPTSPATGLHSITEDQDASSGPANSHGPPSLGSSLSSHGYLQQQTPYSSQTRLSAVSSSQMAYVPTSPLQSAYIASPPIRTSSASSTQQRAAPYTHFSLASRAPPSKPPKTGDARSSTAGTPLPLPGSASTFEPQLPPPNSPASVAGEMSAPPASPLKQLILPALQSSNAQATSNAYRPRPKSRGNSMSNAMMSHGVGAGATRQPVAVSPTGGYARSRPGSVASIRSAAQVPLPMSPPLSGRSEDMIPEEQEQINEHEHEQSPDTMNGDERPTLVRAPDSARSDASFEGLAYLVPHFQTQGQR